MKLLYCYRFKTNGLIILITTCESIKFEIFINNFAILFYRKNLNNINYI